MLSIGIIRNNMTLKSFSKKVDISIYIHEVPHKPDICCIDFFSVVYFILSIKIFNFHLLGGLNVSTGCAQATTSKSDRDWNKGVCCTLWPNDDVSFMQFLRKSHQTISHL